MIIEGDFNIHAPLSEVWTFLSDIERMSVCLPGVDKLERIQEDQYSGTVTVKVGPLAASFQGTVKVTEQQPNRSIRAALQGRDNKTASMVTGEFASELEPVAEQTTRVKYRFDIAIRGRLGQFGQAVILDTSKQLTDQFVQCVRARIEHPHTPVEGSAHEAAVGRIAIRALFNSLRQGWTSLWNRLLLKFHGKAK